MCYYFVGKSNPKAEVEGKWTETGKEGEPAQN